MPIGKISLETVQTGWACGEPVSSEDGEESFGTTATKAVTTIVMHRE